MPLYTKQSLDLLRSKIDLTELLSSHIELKRAGSAHKALCPFHEEKSPSFVVQAGDTHYHCFGCGAHGDALTFLMHHLKISFAQATEQLAERFGVILEKEEAGKGEKGPDKGALKGLLELASHFYHTLLLHTQEAEGALEYLYNRKLDLSFIRAFRLGYAPLQKDAFVTLAKGEGFKEETLIQAGLMTLQGKDFFSERITIPILDPFGAVIGFSARKFKESTFGGKYINTPETLLFKKSQVLFGLSYSRRRIAKEQRAIIVEGQIDALCLIHAGLDFAIASQGTAFGEGHLKEIEALGVTHVFLAFDADAAGEAATVKVGNLFQKKGIAVSVIFLGQGEDPDSFIRKKGKEAFLKQIETASDYLSFLVEVESKKYDPNIPAKKNEMVRNIAEKIRTWEGPVMVHESLRLLAKLTRIPEATLGVGAGVFHHVKQVGILGGKEIVNGDRVLETDLLRWLFIRQEPQFFALVKLNIQESLFYVEECRRVFHFFLECHEKKEPCDLIALGSLLETESEQKLLEELVQKKVNADKAKEGLIFVIERLLLRQWMAKREEIRMQIQSGKCTQEEVLELAKAFDLIKKNKPEVKIP